MRRARSRASIVTIRRPSIRACVGVALSVWVVAAHVYGAFQSVRIKAAPPPVAFRDLSLPLSAADGIRDPYVVVIYRLRNTGAVPITVRAAVGDTPLTETTVAPGGSRRVDIAWDRGGTARDVRLTGSGADWEVEYLELANLHGFTRGTIEFVILPAGQPFARPAAWLAAAALGWIALLVFGTPVALPGWTRALHGALAASLLALFAAAAISPLVSPYRIVLAPHTYLIALAVMAAPQALSLLILVTHRIAAAARASARSIPVAASLAVEWTQVASLAAVTWARASVRVLVGWPWFGIVFGTGIAAYTLVVWTHVGAYAGGADQSGYLNAARLLAQGEVRAPMRTSPGLPRDGVPSLAYAPLGFGPSGADAIVPTYPIGLPLMVVAASPMFGLDAAATGVMVAFTLLGVLLTAWLARECGLSRWGSLLAALILGTSPLYLHMSLQLMSDTPTLVWVTAAVLCAWRSRRSPAWAVGAGLACAMAVLTRPANILAMVPIAVCLGASPRRWAYLGAGGLPGAALLCWFNLAAYGSALTTGYGDSRALFQFANVESSLLSYVTWLPVELTPIGLLALALPAVAPRAARTIAVLAAWILVFLVFYAFYFHTHEAWWYLRFLLPAFPPLIVASLLAGGALLARAPAIHRLGPSARIVAGVILVALVLAHNAWWSRRLFALNVGQDQRDYVEASAWVERHLPADAVILAMQVSGSFFYYTDFPILRYDYLDREPMSQVLASWPDRRLYAVLFPYEIEQRRVFMNYLPGTWTQIGAVKHITVWEYRGPRAAESQ